jgi:hypothetical protein
MRYLAIFGAIMVCFCLSGCIQNDTVIHVKPDGSGTVEETVALSNMLMESMQKFSKDLSEGMSDANSDAKTNPDKTDKPETKPDQDKKEKPEVHDPIQAMMKDARSRETQYGPDVKFVSATPVKTETMSGYRAVYAFKDINSLRINQNPKGKTGMPSNDKEEAGKTDEIIHFKFVKGPVSTLTVTMPEKAKDGKTADEEKKEEQKKKNESDPNADEMLKVFFKDMSIKLVLDIEGTIVDTNATYRDKSQLTLLDIQFGKIIGNSKVLEKMNTAQPKTVEETKELLKGIEGLKIEINNPVVVSFK